MKVNPKRKLVHQAIAQLQALSDLFQKRRVALAASVGLTERQWRVLEEIATEHFIPSMFARGQASSMPAVSKITRQLLDKKFIRVEIDQKDRRQRKYTLTAKGNELLGKLRATRLRIIDQVWMPFDTAKLKAFSDISAQLIKSIESYDKNQE
jgi:DNA-binding MarR family transcriptional regulator